MATVVCLQGDVEIGASESLIQRSPELRQDLALYGGDRVYISEKYHPSIVVDLIEWLEHSEPVPMSDLVQAMSLADDLGIEELVERGVASICERIRTEVQISGPIQRLVESMSEPLRLSLLDHADVLSFDLLRRIVTPYNHQYKRQLEKILPNNAFARSHSVDTAHETYRDVLKAWHNISTLVRHGYYDVDVGARVDKIEFSPDGRHLFTLERVTHVLTLWDLIQQPFQRVTVYNSVVDAAFSTSGSLRTLSLDGRISDRWISDEYIPMSHHTHTIPSLEILSLTRTAPALPKIYPGPPAVLREWYLSLNIPYISDIFVQATTTECISPNGSFIVQCDKQAVRVISTNAESPELIRTLQHPRPLEDDFGDAITVIISADNSIVAAMYVGKVVFWYLNDSVNPQIFDLENLYGETFGHVAFCPDQHYVALGSWEGRITLLEMRDGRFQVRNRIDVGEASLHLAWSPDAEHLASSSYVGVRILNPWRKGTGTHHCPMHPKFDVAQMPSVSTALPYPDWDVASLIEDDLFEDDLFEDSEATSKMSEN